MAARYHLITRFRLSVSRGPAWDTLIAVEKWPQWWRWLDQVQIRREGGPDGVGTVFCQTITSPLLYGLTWEAEIVRVVEHSVVELDSIGALEGRGRFEMTGEERGPTDLRFTWLVQTNKSWMRLLTPVARAAFTWSHDRLMTDFGKGLATAAGGSLIDVSHRAVHPRDQGFFHMPEFEG